MKLRYYTAKLKSDNPKERVAGVDGLLGMGKKGKITLIEYYGCSDEEINFIKKYLLTPNETVQADGYLENPLHLAAQKGFNIAASILIDAGANVNAKNNGGRTPLHWAAVYGQISVAELVIAKNAEVNTRDLGGWTPLHYAAIKDHKKLCELLILKGAIVNAKSYGDETPLYSAASSGNEEIVEYLIMKGAKVNMMNDEGNTALDMALTDKIKSMLRAHGAKTGAELAAEQKGADSQRE